MPCKLFALASSVLFLSDFPSKLPHLNLSSALSPGPHPLSKLLPLRPNIHKPGPRLQHTERIPHKVFIDLLATTLHKTRGTLSLDLACPHAPLDGSQLRGVGHQAQDGQEKAEDGLD